MALVGLLGACSGGGGSGSSEDLLGSDGGSTKRATLSLTAKPSEVAKGGSTELKWQSSNTSSCSASGDWQGSRPVSGTQRIDNIQSNRSFTLSCDGPSGGVMQVARVRIASTSSVKVSLKVDRTAVRENEQANLTWSSTNASTCQASGAWTGQRDTQGSFTTNQLTASSTFQLTCKNAAGDQSAYAAVSVHVADLLVQWRAPTENVDGTPVSGLQGYTVHWGPSTRNYTHTQNVAASVTQWRLDGLASGVYRVAITATDNSGTESDFSNEVEKVVP